MGNKSSQSPSTEQQLASKACDSSRVNFAVNPNLPPGTCQTKSLLPYVCGVDKTGTPSAKLQCADVLSVQINQYTDFQYDSKFEILNQRVMICAYGQDGKIVDMNKVDKFCVAPQGCSISKVITAQTPAPEFMKGGNQSCVDTYNKYIQSQYQQYMAQSPQYILQIQDTRGKYHFVQQKPGSVQQQLADFTPESGNMIIGGSLQLEGLSGYAVFDFPKAPVQSYYVMNDQPYGYYSTQPELKYGGILVVNDQGLQDVAFTQVQVPSGMKIVGFGCTKYCSEPVVIFGYDYDILELMNYQVPRGFGGILAIQQRFSQQFVVNYLVSLFKWALSGGLRLFPKENADIMRQNLYNIVIGRYNLYNDPKIFTGLLDDFIVNYCRENSATEDPICACQKLNSSISFCSDKSCQTVGYKTKQQTLTDCSGLNYYEAMKQESQQMKDYIASQLKQLEEGNQEMETAIQEQTKEYKQLFDQQLTTFEKRNQEIEATITQFEAAQLKRDNILLILMIAVMVAVIGTGVWSVVTYFKKQMTSKARP